MATTSLITGRVPLPSDDPISYAELTFTLSGLDSEGSDVFLPGISKRVVLVDSEIPAGFDLWRNTEGYRGTNYKLLACWVEVTRDGKRDRYAELPAIQIGDEDEYEFADLLMHAPYPTPSNSYWSSITQEEYDAILAAVASPIRTYDTRAAAAAATIPAHVSSVRTIGDVSAGDRLGLDWVRTGSEPASSRKFQSADGQWWRPETTRALVVPGTTEIRSDGDRWRDAVSVKDWGAQGDGLSGTAASNTLDIQGLVNQIIADTERTQPIKFPPGSYWQNGISLDLGASPFAPARVGIMGEGWASDITSADGSDIFLIDGGGISSRLCISDMSFSSALTLDNNAAAAIRVLTGTTLLDFAMSNLYIAGMSKGLSGSFVSGIISGIVFDYLPDNGIQLVSSANRKLVIANNFFFKTKDAGLIHDGSNTQSSGAITDVLRANMQGGGWMVISNNLFDQTWTGGTATRGLQQTKVDGVLVGPNLFNGRTPSSTDYCYAAFEWNDVRGSVINKQLIHSQRVGAIFTDGISNLIDLGLLWRCNMVASASAGALHVSGERRSTIRAKVVESGGVGATLTGCQDCIVDLTVIRPVGAGVKITNAIRGDFKINVLDANTGDAAAGIDSSAVYLQGCSGGDYRISARSTSTSANQHHHVYVDSTCSNLRIFIDRPDSGIRTGAVRVYVHPSATNIEIIYADRVALPTTDAASLADAASTVNTVGKRRGVAFALTATDQIAVAMAAGPTGKWIVIDATTTVTPA